MTFIEFALRMYPWWLAGWTMLLAVFFSPYREVLRVDFKAVKKFAFWIAILTVYRAIIFYFFGDKLLPQLQGALEIPWAASLTVFWEDAIHTLPIALLTMFFGEDTKLKKAIKYLLIILVMISFGLGHVYQGLWAAFFLSFYIPFTLEKGKEYGFGTVMVCHCLYDLVTLLITKAFVG